jgi:hypothetical protein
MSVVQRGGEMRFMYAEVVHEVHGVTNVRTIVASLESIVISHLELNICRKCSEVRLCLSILRLSRILPDVGSRIPP